MLGADPGPPEWENPRIRASETNDNNAHQSHALKRLMQPATNVSCRDDHRTQVSGAVESCDCLDAPKTTEDSMVVTAECKAPTSDSSPAAAARSLNG